MIYYLLFITTIFTIYVEYNVGGILIRQNSTGNLSINIYSWLSYIINPLYNSFLWNLQLLDINYIFIILISLIIYRFKSIKH